MSNSHKPFTIKLDPWSASSLLQKAIRRGEVQLAQRAAAELYRMRGNAIWRRLMNIAIEDVGLGDPDLVWIVTRLATDPDERAKFGSGPKLLALVCAKLASTPKDRSVDYLYCAATKLETALDDRASFDAASVQDRLAVAVSHFEPLPRRAVAALSLCTRFKRDQQLVDLSAVSELIAALQIPCTHPLTKAVLGLAKLRSHPYCLMLLLIWSQWNFTGGTTGIAYDPLPEPEFAKGIPLYTFDKHTSVGKRAISLFSHRCGAVRHILAERIPEERRIEVGLMAAFYADGALVARRLEWFGGPLLQFSGLHADMVSAGSPFEAVAPVSETVRRNLPALNDVRRFVLRRR